MAKYFVTIVFFIGFHAMLSAQFATGLNFNEKAYQAMSIEEKPLGFGENLPKSSSLLKFAPKVENQGSFGTCVGWSSTYYAATIEFARLSKINDKALISSLAFDPYFTYLNITDEKNYFSCAEGTLISSAAELLKTKGLKRYNYNVLECGAKIDISNISENVPLKITEYFRLLDKTLSFEENIANIKQSLHNGHPVVIGMALPQSFYNIDSTGLFKPKTDDKKYVMDYGGHAMCVIGYDDDRLGGTFEIINSWGDTWGNHGIAFVKYTDFVDFTRMAVRYETELTAQAKEIGCVFGNCDNGYGRFVYDNGNLYEGNFLNKERAGFGMYYWDIDKSIFAGEWEKSKRNGKGILMNELGQKQAGFWKNDLFVNNEFVINSINRADLAKNIGANLQFVTPKELMQLLSVQSVVDTIAKQMKQGCIYGNCENGFGAVLGSNFVFYGNFINGQKQGYGEMRWFGQHWGNAYLGNYDANNRSGVGAYFWPNGNKYYGEWSLGSRTGLGTFFNINGDIQAGKFENNNFISEGMGFGQANVGIVLEDEKIEKNVLKDKSTENVPSNKPETIKNNHKKPKK